MGLKSDPFSTFGRFWFPFSGFLLPELYFLQATRGLREFSGNSSGISGDSGEMGEAGAPRTLPSTRAWGQDDGSSHKLPQITRWYSLIQFTQMRQQNLAD